MIAEVGWAQRRLVSEGSDRAGVVIAEVSRAFGFESQDLVRFAPRRERFRVIARQVAMALLREFTSFSTPRIAKLFGLSDHTTVLYAAKRVRYLQSKDEAFAAVMQQLRADLTASVELQ